MVHPGKVSLMIVIQLKDTHRHRKLWEKLEESVGKELGKKCLVRERPILDDSGYGLDGDWAGLRSSLHIVWPWHVWLT